MRASRLTTCNTDDPVWSLVALMNDERFTGEVLIGTALRIRLFALDGQVYYAEYVGDPTVHERLVGCGAVSPEQLAAGTVEVGTVASLSRLFERVPDLDRDEIELVIATATDMLLESAADEPVGLVEVHQLRHHPAGLHRWFAEHRPPARSPGPGRLGPAAARPETPDDREPTVFGFHPALKRSAADAHALDALMPLSAFSAGAPGDARLHHHGGS